MSVCPLGRPLPSVSLQALCVPAAPLPGAQDRGLERASLEFSLTPSPLPGLTTMLWEISQPWGWPEGCPST